MDEQEFRTRADASLTSLNRQLAAASERFDFDVDMNNGALTVEFDDPPAKFVVSPNTPVRQIWVSAHSRSFKLDWDSTAGDFVLAATSQSLPALMAGHIGEQLGEEVTL